MKRIITLLIGSCLLFGAGTCLAQVMYTVTDLGFQAGGLNNLGQVVSANFWEEGDPVGHVFLYSNGTTTDLGSPLCNGVGPVRATGINDSGQIVGYSMCDVPSGWILDDGVITAIPSQSGCYFPQSSFSWPMAINASGQVTGNTCSGNLGGAQAFLYDSKSATLTTFGSDWASVGRSINAYGQITGNSRTYPVTETYLPILYSQGVLTYLQDLPGGDWAEGRAINDAGHIAGQADVGTAVHLFFYDGTMHDWGQFESDTYAMGMNNFDQIVGLSRAHAAFLYNPGTGFVDLNTLVPNELPQLQPALKINDKGQIIVGGKLLTPIYNAIVQQPINSDGSSVFSAKRGAIPVKFAVTQYGTQLSCALPAIISITRAGSGILAPVDESTYYLSADSGSNFRIDSSSCQYVYNLAASALGVGTYRADISINGIMVGHAVFALK